MGVWNADYADVDLKQLTDFLELQGIRLLGRASGHNKLEWPLGKFSQKHGSGDVVATMPSGLQPMTRQQQPDRIASVDQLPQEQGPFNSQHPLEYVPIAGRIDYQLAPGMLAHG